MLDRLKLPIQDCHTVNQFKIRERWLHRYPAGVTINTEYVFCVCVPFDVDITLTEHSAYEWLAKSDALQRVWSETNYAAIEQFVPEAQ